MGFCANCGKQVDEDSTFCNHCGNRITRVETTEQPPQSTVPEGSVKQVDDNISPENGNGKEPAAPSKSHLKRKRSIIGIVAVSLVAIAVAGFFVWYFVLPNLGAFFGDAYVAFNTDGLTLFDEEQSVYIAEGKVDNLSGVVKGVKSIKDITVQVKCGDLAINSMPAKAAANWTVANPALIKGINDVTVTVLTVGNKELTNTISIIAATDDNMADVVLDTKDDDNDGLLNWQELALGTDSNNPDTDGDGLSDYEEVYITRTDPLNADSEGDGVGDGAADPDGDGISNLDEVRLYGTDPLNSDTDGDGLSDYDEIFTYFTDPLVADTDGDGAENSWELLNGFDPLVFNNGFVQTIEAGESSDVMPVAASVTMTLAGEQVGSLSVQPIGSTDEYMLSPMIPGYLGMAYDFSVDGDFTSAEISFDYALGFGGINNDFQPRIYYYDEITGDLLEVPNQKVTNGKVTAVVDHFSKYILLNSADFNAVWDIEIKPPQSAGGAPFNPFEMMLVIDESNSMESYNSGRPVNDRGRIRVAAAQKLVEKLSDDDRAGIVGFSSKPRLLSGLTNDRDDLRTQIDRVSGSGAGTAILPAFNLALEELVNNGHNDSEKIIIVLTDGEDSPAIDIDNYFEPIERARANNIVVYTIGLGEDLNVRLLERIAYMTGGKYFHASEADDVYAGLEFVQSDSIDYTLDSNEDGISNYYSRLIFEGKLRLQNGSAELMGTDFSLNPDMDGDGLLNGEEIQVVESNGRIYVKMVSHPLLKDSDFDMIPDMEDEEPLFPNYFKDSDVDNLMRNGDYEYSKFANEYSSSFWDLLGDGFIAAIYAINLQNDYTLQLADFFMTCTNDSYINDLALKDMKKRIIAATWSSIGIIADNAAGEIAALEASSKEMDDKRSAILENDIWNSADSGAEVQDNEIGDIEELMSMQERQMSVSEDIDNVASEAGREIREFLEILEEAVDLGNNTMDIESFKICVTKNAEASFGETLIRSASTIYSLYATYSDLAGKTAGDIFQTTGFKSAGVIFSVVDIIFETKDLVEEQKLLWDLAKGVAYDSANKQAFMQNLDVLTELQNTAGRFETRKAAKFMIDALYENWDNVREQQIQDAVIKGSGVALDVVMLVGSFLPPFTAVSVSKGVFDTCNLYFGWSDKVETRAQLVCIYDMTIATNRLIDRAYYSDESALTRHLTNLTNLRLVGESRFIEMSTDSAKSSNASNNIGVVRGLAAKMGLSVIK